MTIHWKRVIWISVFVWCWYGSVFAQSHADVVGQAKSSLQAEGADLAGPCGAFKITKRTAWLLRSEMAGLLDKPSGNNCQGFAVDIIVYPTGVHFDILVDGGGSNGPTWNRVAENVDPARWRAPLPDGPTEPQQPGQQPVQSVDLAPVLARIDTLAGRVEVLAKYQQDLERATYDLLRQHDERPTWLQRFFGDRYVQMALASLGTYLTQREMTK